MCVKEVGDKIFAGLRGVLVKGGRYQRSVTVGEMLQGVLAAEAALKKAQEDKRKAEVCACTCLYTCVCVCASEECARERREKRVGWGFGGACEGVCA